MSDKFTLETTNPGSNAGFTKQIPGLLEFRLDRAGNSTPGSATLVVAAVEADDTANPKRFYPYLWIRVLDNDLTVPERYPAFIGKLDLAELREDEQYGRVWRLRARDELSKLADNYVDRGKWQSARGSHSPADDWRPNYVGDYDNTGDLGEYRKNIVMDLALNVINDDDLGLDSATFTLSHPPNSKRIEVNLDNNSNITILDAIRKLANEDPWMGGGGEVDAKDIADAGFPDGSGFGAELQVYYTASRGVPTYFQRGQASAGSQVRYVYGPPTPLGTAPIVEYQFDKEGSDIFSRTRVSGKGEGIYRRGTGDGGQGVKISAMESTWDPENGKFKVRRETPSRFQPDVGDWLNEDQSDEQYAVRARGIRDAAYAQLQSGAAGLAKYRGLNHGTITIPGLPYTLIGGGNPVRPGDLVRVIIPQIGLTDDTGSDFLVEAWSYSYPEDQTIVTLARRNYAGLAEQLVDGLRKQNDALTAHNDFYDSGWLPMDGTGTISLRHSLGVRPREIRVQAALYDNKQIDGLKIPERNTEVEVHGLHYEAGQGQNVGYTVVESTPYDITLKLSRWVAHSEGAGKWFKNNDSSVIYRVVLAP